MKRISESSFKANFSRGGKVEPYQLSPEIEWLATETARLVNLDIAGVDLLFDEQGYKICEANSAPGFKGLELVVGNNIAEQILDYITVKISGSIQSH
jgi:gamma-F420-2:alpha-L-glutamate ligase